MFWIRHLLKLGNIEGRILTDSELLKLCGNPHMPIFIGIQVSNIYDPIGIMDFR